MGGSCTKNSQDFEPRASLKKNKEYRKEIGIINRMESEVFNEVQLKDIAKDRAINCMIGFLKGGAIGAKLNQLAHKDITPEIVQSALSSADNSNSNET